MVIFADYCARMYTKGCTVAKKRRMKKILRTTKILLHVTVMTATLALILLSSVYIPTIQRIVVHKVCNAIHEKSGFMVSMNSFTLSFPLELSISGLEISKNDTCYLKGEHIGTDISLQQLTAGKIEINHISLEHIEIDTRDLIPNLHINGEIGYARVSVRDADIRHSIANVTQLHIQESDLVITMAESTDDDNQPIPWSINLRSGTIKDCSISLALPGDTVSACIQAGNLQLKNGSIDLSDMNATVKGVNIRDTRVAYDRGTATRQEAPLDHLELEHITIDADNIYYSDRNIDAEINGITFRQPGGIEITKAAATLNCSSDTIALKRLHIASRNGSNIRGEFVIPRSPIERDNSKNFQAKISATLNRKDLAGFVTDETYSKLGFFNENILNTEFRANGNIHDIAIDSMSLSFPGLGEVDAKGHVTEILKKDAMTIDLALRSKVDDIGRIAGYDTIPRRRRASVTGHLRYGNATIETRLAMRSSIGKARARATYGIADTTYNADIDIEGLTLADIMPDVPLYNLTMSLNAEGKGIDLFNDSTRYRLAMKLDTLHYSDYRFNSLVADATQSERSSRIEINGTGKNQQFGIKAITEFKEEGIENRTTIELDKVDFSSMGVLDKKLMVSTGVDLALSTDLDQSHTVKLEGRNTMLDIDTLKFTPKDLTLDFATTPSKSSLELYNGDMTAKGTMDCGYSTLFASLVRVMEMYRISMGNNKTQYYLHDFQNALPHIDFELQCGKDNIFHNFLVFNGISTGSILLDADISPNSGLNINGSINRFRSGELQADTIKIFTRQRGERLNYLMGIDNASLGLLTEQNSYNAAIYGNVVHDTLTTYVRMRDNVRASDSKIGMSALLMPESIGISFDREALIFNTPFKFSRNNHIDIKKGLAIDADVLFSDSEGTGFYLYTTPDNKAKYNATLELNRINFAKISDNFPGLPQLAGSLSASLNYRQTRKGDIINGDVSVNGLAYENNTIGNEKITFSYSPEGKDIHDIKAILQHNGRTVVKTDSKYDSRDAGTFDGELSFIGFPLAMSSAFIDKETVKIDGYLNSHISFKGEPHNLTSNGFVRFDSTYIHIPILGATLRATDEKVNIDAGQVRFRNFHIYDRSNTPFVINGTAEIKELFNPQMRINLSTSNYRILNAARRPGRMLYGDMSIDLNTAIRGKLDNLRVSGNVSVLGNSNFAYVLPESSFDSSKELDGLVDFVNFNDTTEVSTEKPIKLDLGNINANLNIFVKEGAKITLDLDERRDNYISLEGDGNLNATYNTLDGVAMTGIYKLNGGQIKLTLPIIPLKTFHIQEGGKLTWTGNMLNPSLDVTALERTTVSVEFDDNSIQPVPFDVGVVLNNDVNNIGISFTMSSPENSIIQEQLNSLDKETLSRYAVAMIITGTYLGGRKGVTASNALSSFIDAKINDISGSAIKDFDVNIGINDALNAETGDTYKNYSFSFSKRFFNDRIRIVVGGEVKSGENAEERSGNNSFINNVSLEWKLNDTGNRSMRIFYDKNYQSILEGEIIETGIGYVYKKKMNELKELFGIKKKKETESNVNKERRRMSND